MKIVEVKENKKQYLDLLLLADEQEDMVDRYLDKGKMYVLDDIGAKCECVITDEGNGILEIKNIATVPEYQGKGYARALIEFVINNYRGKYSILQVGTGDSPLSIPFYEKCGFVLSLIHIYKGEVRIAEVDGVLEDFCVLEIKYDNYKASTG